MGRDHITLFPHEQAELRALVEAAWPYRGTPAINEHAAAIYEWHILRPLARGDIQAARTLARTLLLEALEAEHVLPIPALIDLLRRTDPARIPARRAVA